MSAVINGGEKGVLNEVAMGWRTPPAVPWRIPTVQEPSARPITVGPSSEWKCP